MAIYFIQEEASGYIKIGFTAGPVLHRLSNLQSGNPSQLILLLTLEGGQERESSLHRQFGYFRERGEWFQPVWMLLGFIYDHAEDSLTEPQEPFDPLGLWKAIKRRGKRRAV